jgi:hypothetical protein
MEFNHAPDEEDKETLKGLVTYFGSKVSHLQEVKLGKLIYISQLYHYSRYGKFLVKIPFVSLSRGPHAPTIRSIVKEQLESHAIYIKVVSSNKDPFNPCLIIRSHELETKKLNAECLNTVREVIEDWGDRRFKDILDYTTRTIPFISTAYRASIDLARCEQSLSLRHVLSLPERIRIHQFVQAPDEEFVQDNDYRNDGLPISVNEVVEIYLALCGDHPEKIPSRDHLGFNTRSIFDVFSHIQNENKNETDKPLNDIDKAAKLTGALWSSNSFRLLNHSVALKTGMLLLKRLGYSFQRKENEEILSKAYDYKSIREWFDIVLEEN